MASISGNMAEAYVMRKLYSEKLKSMETGEEKRRGPFSGAKSGHGIFQRSKKVRHSRLPANDLDGKLLREENGVGLTKQ
ncbi:hypothetical protein AMTRI_Chr04g189010 [Amborella trichopoda]